MSDPSFVHISFKIKPEMPSGMKQYLLLAFTDYYTKYFPDQKPTQEEIEKLTREYEPIATLWRNDVYHNVGFQRCQLDPWDMERPTNPDFPEIDTVGISITTLPRLSSTIENFFKLVGPYITSSVCSLGYQHEDDYGQTADYFYFDNDGNIRKKVLKPANEDEVIWYKGN